MGHNTQRLMMGAVGGGASTEKIYIEDVFSIWIHADNATDFGDLTLARSELAACSNGHGGLF